MTDALKEKKNRLIYLLAFCVLTASLLVFGVSVIRGGEKEVLPGFDSINQDASQVLVTGNNYSLDNKVEEEFLQNLQEKEPREQEQVETNQESIVPPAEEPADSPEESEAPKEEAPSTNNDEQETEVNSSEEIQENEQGDEVGEGSSGGNQNETEGHGDSGPSTSHEDDEKDSEPASKKPTIECSLMGVTEIDGGNLVFTLRAKDYKNQVIDPFYYTVKLDGDNLYSTGTSDDGYVTYRSPEPLSEGVHQVDILVEDLEQNSETFSFVLNAKANEEVLQDEYVSLTVEARILGLGTLLSAREKIYEGESASHFIERVLEMNGFSVASSGGIYGYYLGEISKPGILGSLETIKIPEILEPYLQDVDVSIEDRNSLGERDFTGASGWVYLYNYSYMGVGLSNITLYDGDEIIICFTLANGAEFDGTWFRYGEW